MSEVLFCNIHAMQKLTRVQFEQKYEQWFRTADQSSRICCYAQSSIGKSASRTHIHALIDTNG